MKKEIVIDCSVSASWVLPDESTEKSKSLLSDVLDARVILFEPMLWRYEINNLLRTALLRKRLSQELAIRSLGLLEEIPIEFVPPASQSQVGILTSALHNQLSAYDASYFHLAESP